MTEILLNSGRDNIVVKLGKKYWLKSLLLAIAVPMVGLLPMLVMNSDANTGEPEMEPLTGYAWQKISNNGAVALYSIGSGKVLFCERAYRQC
ncbi:MAG: hypothetical protein RQM95_12325 [Syntrophaceticus schinkii]